MCSSVASGYEASEADRRRNDFAREGNPVAIVVCLGSRINSSAPVSQLYHPH